MQLRADIQLRAAIKALTDTVAPSIDAENKLAVDQLAMVIGALKFVEQTLPLQFQFDCNELGRLLDLAAALENAAHGCGNDGVLDGVRRAAEAGALIFDRAKADPAEVLGAVRDLRAECSAATTASFHITDRAVAKAVTDTVLAYSMQQTLRDRSWLQGLGFEGPDAGIPPILKLLADDAADLKAHPEDARGASPPRGGQPRA